ncbi:MAG: competence/damage-inducible protein A [Ignavibacteria bacterium]|nr:competence/damage-inducible protein A [Ignavibacteria bacterium]
MKSKIITVGDEILMGHIVNSNSAYISDKLYSVGLPVEQIVTVGDNEEAILTELRNSFGIYNVIILTGGLGPTHDDITKSVLVKFFDDELKFDEKVYENIISLFKIRGISMPETNKEQAMVPKNSKVIWNKNGTAPGIWMEKDDKILIALPGVPLEMKPMLDESVIPSLREKFSESETQVQKNKIILTTGISETSLFELLGNIKDITGDDCKIAFLPSFPGVKIRIDASDVNEILVNEKISEVEKKIRAKAEDFIYGVNDDKLEKIVGDLLVEKKLTLSVAESCSGGLFASLITDVPGSSKYFLGGVCSYSNESKIKLLKVKKKTIEKYGAVSKETALEMAVGVRNLFKSNVGMSVTGIAGPEGGTENKPVGLVWIGCSFENKTFTAKHLFGDNRLRTKLRSVMMALSLLRKELM